MASLNFGQDVANKRERKLTAAHIAAKSYPLCLAVRMRRYGSLLNINPSLLVQTNCETVSYMVRLPLFQFNFVRAATKNTHLI